MTKNLKRKEERPDLKKLAKFLDKRLHNAPDAIKLRFLETMCLEAKEYGEMPVDAAAIQAETGWPMEWAKLVFNLWSEYKSNGGGG